jgi:hypothetical protein
MRTYLYMVAGITSALIGWNMGQFFISDLGWLNKLPEIILFPCITISLAIGMVLNEIFLSSPTRPKLNLRSAPIPIAIAAALGLGVGLFAGLFVQILFLPQLRIPSFIVRVFGWLCIGSAIGLAEGYTWRWRSIEAGNKLRFRKRFKTSIIAGSLASLAAAVLFEILRLLIGQPARELAGIEDPIGFSILGALLGLAFSLTISPSYMVALRAGAGFEYSDFAGERQQSESPRIADSLRFISISDTNYVEEGLSIQLPVDGKITIGSAPNADIYIPGIADHAAHIEFKARDSLLVANENNLVEVNGEKLTSNKPIPLKHNHIITFRATNKRSHHAKEFYRFVYYNRFLDPQA